MNTRWTIPIFALLGLVIGLVAFTLRTPTYEAEALVTVSNPVSSLEDEIAVVLSSTVLDASANALGFEPEISVTAATVAGLLEITAQTNDAQQAADAANTVAATYVQAQDGAAASVAQLATVPTSPSGLPVLIYAVLGSLLGAIAGMIVRYLQGFRTEARPEPEPLPLTVPDPTPGDSVMSDAGPDRALAPMQSLSQSAAPPPPKTSSFSAIVSEALSDDMSAQHESVMPQEFEPPTQSAAPPLPPSAMWSDGGAQAVDIVDIQQPPVQSRPVVAVKATEPAQSTAPELSMAQQQGMQERKHLEDLERRALASQFEAAHYELQLQHQERLAHLEAEHERTVSDLRGEIAELNKKVRTQQAQLKDRTGTDQNRVGDLEAQTAALETELVTLRQKIESQRITHTKALTEERGAADRALDNARRQYREELSKHVHTHRQALADHRADLDEELAKSRGEHAQALDAAHVEYERQLDDERRRLDEKVTSALDRQQKELADVRAAHRQELNQQALRHKEMIAGLRVASDSSDGQLRELEKANRALRVELSTLQKNAQQAQNEHATSAQRLSDEIAILRGELDVERERNSALRSDVLRRSAEAHQAIDRAVEERTAQLSELEASVARQREYADRRVREVSASAEEQARQASMREADLTATISRLKRELAKATKNS